MNYVKKALIFFFIACSNFVPETVFSVYLGRFRCFPMIIALFLHPNHALQKKERKEFAERPTLTF